jgi:hypothetical protein
MRFFLKVSTLFAFSFALKAFACVITITPTLAEIGSSGAQMFTATSGCTVSWTTTAGTVTPKTGKSTVLKVPAETSVTTVTVTASVTGASMNATVTVNPAITAGFWGLDINQTAAVGVPSGETDPWPTAESINFGVYRTLGSSVKWSDLITSCTPSPTYNWTGLNEWLSQAQQNGQQVMFTAYYTPSCFVTQQNNGGCTYSADPEGCYLPYDINTDGTGTDAIWPGFINDLLTHLATTNGPTGAAYIHSLAYLEVWNEPNVTNECNGTDHAGGTGNCTAPALARYTADAWTKVQSFNSTYGTAIKVVSPAVTANNPFTDCTQAGNQSTINSFLNTYLTVSPVQGYSNSLNSYVNFVGFHGYVDLPNGTGSDDPASGAKCISDLISSVQNVANGDGFNQPLYDTEGSWGANPKNLNNPQFDSLITSSSDGGGTGREQAFTGIYNLIQASLTAQVTNTTNCTKNSGICPVLGGFNWYGWDFQVGTTGAPSTGQYWDETGSGALAGAGVAYQNLYNWLSGADLSTTFAAPYQPCALTQGSTSVWTCQFVFPNGKYGLAVWDQAGTCSVTTCTTTQTWSVPTTPSNAAYTTQETLGGTTSSIQNDQVSLSLQPLLLHN